MSVIAVKILPNGFEMCADSLTALGRLQFKGTDQGNPAKLYEVNNVVVGSAGNAEENTLMQLFLLTHSISSPDEKSILEFLGEFSDWKKLKTDNGSIRNSYLIGIKGKVFSVDGWCIGEVKTYAAIGEGMYYALSAMYLGHSSEKAVETAIELSIYCENPIIKIIKINKDK